MPEEDKICEECGLPIKVETLNVSWAVGKFESWQMTIDAAEKIAVDILMEETESA